MKLISYHTLTLSAVATLLVGCSTRQHPTIERAEADLENARVNTQIMAFAPAIVEEAEVTLEDAKNEWKNDRDMNEVDHLIYLTERKLAIAKEETRRQLALSNVAGHQASARLAAGDIHAQEALARARMNDLAVETRRQSVETQQLIKQLQREVLALKSKQTARGLELTLAEGVLFESGQAELKPGAVLKLTPLTNFLKQYPARTVTIEGHTDNVGTDSYNLALSQQRADSVRDLLVSEGIDNSRILTRGMGKRYPVTTNMTDAGRLQNRRVEIIISE